MAADPLNELYRQRRLWRGSRTPATANGVGTGFPSLDGILPQQGWPPGAVIEVTVSDWGIGELSLFLSLMSHFTRLGRYVTWVAPPHAPYAPALAAEGLDLGLCRVLLNPGEDREILWAAEKLLHSSACGLVLAWPRSLADRSVRRLQLAVEESKAVCVLWRRAPAPGEPAGPAWEANPAAMRLRLSRDPQGLKVEIVKARGTCRGNELVLDI